MTAVFVIVVNKTAVAWRIHVNVGLYFCLRVGKHKIDRSCLPLHDDGKYQNKAYGRPCNYWRVRVPVVDALCLHAAVGAKSCLPLYYLTRWISLFFIDQTIERGRWCEGTKDARTRSQWRLLVWASSSTRMASTNFSRSGSFIA